MGMKGVQCISVVLRQTSFQTGQLLDQCNTITIQRHVIDSSSSCITAECICAKPFWYQSFTARIWYLLLSYYSFELDAMRWPAQAAYKTIATIYLVTGSASKTRVPSSCNNNSMKSIAES